MDPVAAHDFRALVRELQEENRTILLTTHDLAEAEMTCDRVTLVDRGRILATDNPRTIGALITRHRRIDVDGATREVVHALESVPGVVNIVERDGLGIRVETDQEEAAAVVLRLLLDAGITDVRTSLPSLEEVYLDMIDNRGMQI
jgi:ABC-2 type transport system ATP-binding protein